MTKLICKNTHILLLVLWGGAITVSADTGVPLDISSGFNQDAWCGAKEYQVLLQYNADQGTSYTLVDSQAGTLNNGNWVQMNYGLPQFLLSQQTFMIGAIDNATAQTIGQPEWIYGGASGQYCGYIMPSRWDGPAYISDSEGTPLDGVLTSSNDGRTYHIASHGGNVTLTGDWLEVADPVGGDGDMGVKSNAMCVFSAYDRTVAQVVSATATLPAAQQKRYPSINFVLGAYDLGAGARNMQIVAIYTDDSEEVIYSFPTDDQKHGPMIRDAVVDVVPAGVFFPVETFTKSYAIYNTIGSGSGTLFEFTEPLPLNANKTLKAIRLADTNAAQTYSSRGLAIFGATGSTPPPERGSEYIFQ